MNKVLLAFITFSVVLSVIIFPEAVYAAPPQGCADYSKEIMTDFGCFPNNPIGFAQKFYGYGLAFVAGISMITLILGGYSILTSRGEPGRVNIGKSYIFYSITGLLLAIFGWVFIEVVVVGILRVPGFKP